MNDVKLHIEDKIRQSEAGIEKRYKQLHEEISRRINEIHTNHTNLSENLAKHKSLVDAVVDQLATSVQDNSKFCSFENDKF
jgi:septal ring factor EnvC (AmiA/AmiB activator)